MELIEIVDAEFAPSNAGNLEKISLVAEAIQVARQVGFSTSVSKRSISIYSPIKFEYKDSKYVLEKKLKASDLFKIKKNKPFDIILFMNRINTQISTDVESFEYFIHEPGFIISDGNLVLREKSKVLLAVILFFLVRGYMPTKDDVRSKLPLPALIKDKLLHGVKFFIDNESEIEIMSEADLAGAASSFDLQSMNNKKFLDSISIYDTIIVNRIKQGMAGHKPLKVANDLKSIFKVVQGPKPKELEIADTLADFHGVYKNLHPAYGIPNNNFKDFYKNCLKAIWESIPMDNRDSMKNHKAIKMDNFILSGEINSFVPTYKSWDMKILKEEVGIPYTSDQ